MLNIQIFIYIATRQLNNPNFWELDRIPRHEGWEIRSFKLGYYNNFNSMGGGHMNLSDYMGGRGLWKFNSMGGGVEKKVPSSPPPGIFFWNSPHTHITIFR